MNNLAPVLFILYISDVPEAVSKKYTYANDMVNAVKHKSIERTEEIPTGDLEFFVDYYCKQ